VSSTPLNSEKFIVFSKIAFGHFLENQKYSLVPMAQTAIETIVKNVVDSELDLVSVI